MTKTQHLVGWLGVLLVLIFFLRVFGILNWSDFIARDQSGIAPIVCLLGVGFVVIKGNLLIGAVLLLFIMWELQTGTKKLTASVQHDPNLAPER